MLLPAAAVARLVLLVPNICDVASPTAASAHLPYYYCCCCTTAESVTSGSPNTAAGYLESPKAAAAHQQHQHQREQQQQDGKRKPYKVHGMDPYDYWSLIKSL